MILISTGGIFFPLSSCVEKEQLNPVQDIKLRLVLSGSSYPHRMCVTPRTGSQPHSALTWQRQDPQAPVEHKEKAEEMGLFHIPEKEKLGMRLH